MYCLECERLINNRIVYFNLFKRNVHKVCDICFMKTMIEYKYEIIPLNNYMLHLNIVENEFNNKYSIMSFLKPYYINYLKNKLNITFILIEELNTKLYNLINKTNIGDIYMVVLKNKIEKRNGYEN